MQYIYLCHCIVLCFIDILYYCIGLLYFIVVLYFCTVLLCDLLRCDVVCVAQLTLSLYALPDLQWRHTVLGGGR